MNYLDNADMYTQRTEEGFMYGLGNDPLEVQEGPGAPGAYKI
jgi:hypothetical protein